MYGHTNFDERPFVAVCRACAQPMRNALELSTTEAKHLIDEIAAMEVPVFVITGGDPLKRPDIFELVKYATDHKVRISLTPSATPLLIPESIVRLKECGLARLAGSLDGATAAIHDAFRGVPGSHQWTLNAVHCAPDRSSGADQHHHHPPQPSDARRHHRAARDPRHHPVERMLRCAHRARLGR